MEETGVVMELTKDGRAIVQMSKSGGCEGCKAAGTCKAISGDRVLEADNKIGAVPGQQVILKIDSGMFLKSSFIVYMIPVIFLFIGAALGGKYGPAINGSITLDYWQAIGGCVFLGLSVVLIRVYDRMIKGGKGLLRPEITKIVG
jgi:sigma-E factor negative regulatory protein RseC